MRTRVTVGVIAAGLSFCLHKLFKRVSRVILQYLVGQVIDHILCVCPTRQHSPSTRVTYNM